MKDRRGVQWLGAAIGVVLAVGLWVGGTALLLPAVQADMYVYPAKGQDKAQQDKDTYGCHAGAGGQTGYDPTKATASAPAAPEASGGAVRGAARGAALGAVGGAIAGDAGKGAAVGAAVGGAGGAMRQRHQKQEAAAEQQQAAQAQEKSIEAYNRAKATCLQGRGYTVSP